MRFVAIIAIAFIGGWLVDTFSALWGKIRRRGKK